MVYCPAFQEQKCPDNGVSTYSELINYEYCLAYNIPHCTGHGFYDVWLINKIVLTKELAPLYFAYQEDQSHDHGIRSIFLIMNKILLNME